MAQPAASQAPIGGHSFGGRSTSPSVDVAVDQPVSVLPDPGMVPPVPDEADIAGLSLHEAETAVPVIGNVSSWSFNFQDAPWPVVIGNLSGQFGFSVDFVERPKSTFSYFDDNSYSVNEALDVLNDHLLREGFIIIRNQRNLTVINASNQIPDSMVPFVGIHDLAGLGRNELASVAFPIRNTDPVQAVEEIGQLVSALGQVKPLSDSGRVIITDTGSYLRRLGDLLLQRGIGGKLVESIVYQLSHASAEEIANSINEFLTGQSQQNSGGLLRQRWDPFRIESWLSRRETVC